MTRTVVLADDQPALRLGLRRVLDADSGFEVVGEAGSAESLLRVARDRKPATIVMDLHLDGLVALDAIQKIRAGVPQSAILVFSGGEEARHVRRALKSGAVGYVLKTAEPEEIRKAVRLAADGTSYISPEISEHVVHAILREDENEGALGVLTPREREVLKLVAEGLSSRQIASELGVSPKTVETHRARMMSKLGIHKSSKLVRFAIEAGVLED